MYSTDNGPHMNTWPDGGDDAVPQREEHQLGGRVPGAGDGPLAREDPGRGGLQRDRQHLDWLPTFLADGRRAGDRWRSSRTGTRRAARRSRSTSTATTCCRTSPARRSTSPRTGFFYFSDDGDLVALRFDNWKIVFMEQRAPGTLRVWAEPFVAAAGAEALQPAHRPVRAGRHHLEHLLRLAPRPRLPGAGGAGGRRRSSWQTFRKFPPRQKAASFTIDQALEKMQDAAVGHH